MIEWLDHIIVWWHWLIFGIFLIAMELISGTFLMLGIGIAAIITAIITLIFTLTFATELLLWVILAIIVIIIWYKKTSRASSTQVGQPHYRVNILGTVIEDIIPPNRGKVIFDEPVLGNREWPAFADMPLKKGDRVKIVKIQGQLIKVKKKER